MSMTLALRMSAIALFALPAGATAGTPAPETARLPDLDQEAPAQLEITRAGPPGRPVERLGFRSAVRNIGEGPLVVAGQRPDTSTPTMSANQLVAHADGRWSQVPGVGMFRYVVSPDHRHWHLLRFDRYELRRAGHRVAVVRDRKSGFCLGDRYPATARRLAAAPPFPVFTTRCGLDQPQLLTMREGISVGYGDDYAPTLEGQYLPLRGLSPGRYVLVHRVNGDRRLRELDYANNAASLLLELRRDGGSGAAEVRVLRTCPETALCDERAAARRSASARSPSAPPIG
jgi:hypothetical protein